MNVIHELLNPSASESPRAQKRRDTALRILNTAMVIITEEGIDRLTMQSLSKRLDYAVGALYRYFPSKEVLLAGVQVQVVRAVHDDVQQILKEVSQLENVSSLLKLKAAFLTYSSLPKRRPRQFGLLSVSIGDPRPFFDVETADPAVREWIPLVTQVAELFEEAAGDGTLNQGDALQRTVTIWGGMQGVLNIAKLDRFGAFPSWPRHETLINTLLVGWGASLEDCEACSEVLQPYVDNLPNEGSQK